MSLKLQSVSKISADRELAWDALRIFAAFWVVATHVIGPNWSIYAVGTPQWFFVNLYGVLTRCAVPLFLMVSGAAFLRRPEPPTLSRLFRKNIAHLLTVYLVWVLLYAMDTVSLPVLFSREGPEALLQACLKPKYHLWFLPRMIGTYLLLPVLWAIAHCRQGRYVRYLSVLFLLLYFLPRSLNTVPELQPYAKFLLQFELPLTSFFCYVLLGYALSRVELRRLPTWALLAGVVLTIVAAAGWNWFQMVHTDNHGAPVYDMTALSSCLEAGWFFLLFRRLGERKLPRKLTAVICELSSCTLTVYLLHVFILERLQGRFDLSAFPLGAALGIPAVSLLIFLLCLPVAAVLRRIPRLGKWIC